MSDIAVRAPSVRRYIFYNEHRPSRSWMPRLEMINERFCQNLRTALVQQLRPGVEVTPPLAIQLIKCSELIGKLAQPSHLTLAEITPLRGTILVVVDAALVSWIVESRFGGDGRFPLVIDGRGLSPFENKAASRVVQTVLEQFALAWQPIAALEPHILDCQPNPQFAAIAKPGDQIILNVYDVQIGRGGGKLSIAVPYPMLEPLHDRLVGDSDTKTADVDPSWQEALRLRIGQATMTLRVELAELPVTVADLLALRPGSVFAIERPESVVVEANGVPLFRGRWGKHDQKIGVRIDERLEDAPAMIPSVRRQAQKDHGDER